MLAVLARAVADFRLGVTLAGCLVGYGPVVRQDRAAGHAARRAATPSEASQPRKGRVAAVADNDWRVTVTLDDQAHAGRALRSLREHEVEDDVRRRLGHRVAVSADGARVFLYAGTEIAAREADRVVREVMAQRHIGADVAVGRWHPAEQEWQDADVAMPQTDEQRQAEHKRLEEEETRESLASGHPRWEVRVELSSHHDAVALAGRLQAEGRPVIRRWKFLVLGANDEDDARDLARVIKQEAPAAASVHAEQVGPLLPFAQYGPIPVW